jgi:hypothetical protein
LILTIRSKITDLIIINALELPERVLQIHLVLSDLKTYLLSLMSYNVPSICDVAVLVFRLAHLLPFLCIFSLNSCKRCDKSHVPKGTDVLLLNFIPSSANGLLYAVITCRVKSFSLLQLNKISIFFLNQQISS